MTRGQAALLTVLLAACGDTPRQYVRAEYEGAKVRWAQRKLTLYVQDPAPDSSIDGQTLKRAVEVAAQAWQSRCRPFELVVLRTQAEVQIARDSVNVVVIQRQRWCPRSAESKADCYDPRLEALTHLYKARPAPGELEARIEEADIQLNAVHHQLSSEMLVPTLVHELGHLLGLRHACSTVSFAEAAGLSPCRPGARLAMHPDPAARIGLLEPAPSELRFVCETYGGAAEGSWQFVVWAGGVATVLLLAITQLWARLRTTRPRTGS